MVVYWKDGFFPFKVLLDDSSILSRNDVDDWHDTFLSENDRDSTYQTKNYTKRIQTSQQRTGKLGLQVSAMTFSKLYRI